eukprot:scaffold34959_cov52-Phaeocystis_antarctica.AAC.2
MGVTTSTFSSTRPSTCGGDNTRTAAIISMLARAMLTVTILTRATLTVVLRTRVDPTMPRVSSISRPSGVPG